MDARTLGEVMGWSLSLADYERLLPGMENAMIAAHINTPDRAAMWCAQIGHESVGLRYMEEIASGQAYEWRKDLGNIYAGDGVRFKGSGPIQLTGRGNFRAFTQWCRANGHTTIDFEAAPHLVREVPKWGFLAASWYWTAARPQINSMADRKDLEGVTRAINGGLNGLADRRNRYNRALAMGDRIMPGKVGPVVVQHPMGEQDGSWSVSSGFGPRWGTFHNGLDFAANTGTPIYAVADGVVIQGNDRPAGTVEGFGNWVWIDHQPSLGVDTIYGHMRHASILVRQGDRVKAGQKIAEVGSEGQSTGPHLHFEVWSAPGRIGGKALDPDPWLKANITDNIAIAATAAEEDEMSFTDDDRRMLRAVHHELTHRFDSRYDLDRLERGEITDDQVYRETMIGYILNVDRKIEDMHSNMLPAIAKYIRNLFPGNKKGR